MLASVADAPFDDPAWAFELKWDGYRALALVTSDATVLRSRNGQDLTRRYPELGDLRRRLMCQEAVLDGEVVVLRPDGTPDFGALAAGRGPFTYVVFDLLHVDGAWIEDLPWRERRARLAQVVAPEGPPLVVLSDHVEGEGTALFAAAAQRGLEGIMAKRMDAPYRPGRRVNDWRKIKTRQELEVVIGGFTEGAGSRRGTIGALLVGERGADGALTYLSHVGSGLSDAVARALWDRLRAAEVDASPFANPVPDAPATPRWVRPEITCEVRFAERTADGRLRAPVFHGLVEDPVADIPAGPFSQADGSRTVEEGERRITLTNLDKPYWPREGITKGNLLDHYLRVAPVLVPHLEGRPMILKRFPNGIEEDFFFQHSVTDAPPWLARADLSRSGRPDDKLSHYVMVDDPLGAAVAGQPGLHRPQPVAEPGPRAGRAHPRPVRPRPGRRAALREGGGGGPAGARRARGPGPARLSAHLGGQRHAHPGARGAGAHLRRRAPVRACGQRGTGRRAPGPGDHPDQDRRPRRPGVPGRQPERPRQAASRASTRCGRAPAPRSRPPCAGRRWGPAWTRGPSRWAWSPVAWRRRATSRPACWTTRSRWATRSPAWARAPREGAGRSRRPWRPPRSWPGARARAPTAPWTRPPRRPPPAPATSSAPGRTAWGRPWTCTARTRSRARSTPPWWGGAARRATCRPSGIASVVNEGPESVPAPRFVAVLADDGGAVPVPRAEDVLRASEGPAARRALRRLAALPARVPAKGAATYYVVLDGVRVAEVDSVRMVVVPGEPITLAARRR